MSNTPAAPSQSILRQILDYDPTTHSLTPKASVPIGLPKATKHGKHQLYIGTQVFSMAKIAYVYHHGKQCNKVTRVDGDKNNYAPSNLTGYVPAGRKLLATFITTITDNDQLRGKIFRAVLHAPTNPPYKPEAKYVPIYDDKGYAITGTDPDYVKRVAAKFGKAPTRADLIKLGMIDPTKHITT